MSGKIPTPHINAKLGDFAETVLMPGDPLRAKYIAEHYLEHPKLVNEVRNVLGYTGTYQGKPVSVMASGMGCPSIGIYSYELFNFYDVKNIIRLGSAGALSPDLRLKDIVVGMSAYTNSGYLQSFGFHGSMAPCCSWELLRRAMAFGETLDCRVVAGPLFSSDGFYGETDDNKVLAKCGVLAVEMEAAALYINAAMTGKNALAICTISDHLLTGESLSAEDRQNSFHDMIKLALEIA